MLAPPVHQGGAPLYIGCAVIGVANLIFAGMGLSVSIALIAVILWIGISLSMIALMEPPMIALMAPFFSAD